MPGKMIMTKGLPGSGKTTWAYEQPHVTVVCKDDIRKNMEKGGWKWSQEGEKEVLKVRDEAIRTILRAGGTVIVADTNLAPKHERRLQQLAGEYKAAFEVKSFLDVPVEECIRRNAQRTPETGLVDARVIIDMHEKYLARPIVEALAYVPAPGLPSAVICDLDGTLALHAGKRGPFEYEKCAEDEVNPPVHTLICNYHALGYQIVYCSGREEKAREGTFKFLERHECPVGQLFMRPNGDFRKDAIVKREIFDREIRDKYRVEFVLDDRDQVVKMWRELGLTCLQVAYGNF